MKIKFILTCIALNILFSCYAQKQTEIMPEKYDFELMRKIKQETGAISTVIKRGNLLIYITPMTDDGAFYNEYSLNPQFYAIQKKFYPNGNLKSKVQFIGEYILTGESIYYDENGNITKVDEDAKFGKIKPDWILKFIEKEGWIDLKTGRGREELEILEEGIGRIKHGAFLLKFFSKGEFVKYPNSSLWIITIRSRPENENYRTRYFIDGDTGEVLEKQRERILYKE